jgi:hypothetical protein
MACLLAAWLFARQLKDIRHLARPILEQRGLLGPSRQNPLGR